MYPVGRCTALIALYKLVKRLFHKYNVSIPKSSTLLLGIFFLLPYTLLNNICHPIQIILDVLQPGNLGLGFLEVEAARTL